MGITGLLPFLQKSSRRANIREFSGATVAIDAYCWLHKGAFSCAEKLVMKEHTTMYVTYCMKFVNMLLSHNIKPILVFDGQNLPAKEQTEIKRRQSRDVNRQKGMQLMRAGRVSEGRNVLRRALDVTHEMALEVIRECRRRNVDCIVAPYEADAQLAFLNIQGIAHVIITEDSDLMLFGCKTVMFKMDVNGNGVVVDSSMLYLSMGVRQDLFTLEKFRLMCILSGCDYVDSLPGIGLSKACKFVTRTSETDIYRALQKLPANLNMWTLEMTDEYRQAVVAADLTFRCQLVYDPRQRRQVPLTEPRNGEHVVGEMKDDATALQLALGNFHPKDLRRLDNYDPDNLNVRTLTRSEEALRAPHPSIWSKGYTRSAQPKKIVPTITRLSTIGQTVETAVNIAPALKRDSQSDSEEGEINLLTLYGGRKKLRTMSTVESLQSSRYFMAGNELQKNVALRASGLSPKDAFDLEETETSISLPEASNESLADYTEVDLFAEEENHLLSSNSSGTSTSSKLNEVLGQMSKITTNSLVSSQSTNSSAKSEESTCDNGSKPALRAFQLKSSQNSCSQPIQGLVALDTVGTDTSVFFGGSAKMQPSTTKPARIRTGLSRRHSLKPSPQQSLLSQFGFKVGSAKQTS